MKITKRQLRRIIKEATAANLLKGIDTSGTGTPPKKDVIYVEEGPYGISVYDIKGDYRGVGEMVLKLVEMGEVDFFKSPNDKKALEKLMKKHDEGVQGGMQRWDSDVFETYYDVDLLRAIQMYADMHDLKIIYRDPEEDYY